MRSAVWVFVSLVVLHGETFTQETQRDNSTSFKLDDGKVYQYIDAEQGWQALSTCPENVQLITYHPMKPERLLVSVGSTLYSVYPERQEWSVVFTRGDGFIPQKIKFSRQKEWEVWMVGGIMKKNGTAGVELWISHDGGLSWTFARFVPADAHVVHLDPDTPQKYWIEDSPQNGEETKP